MTNNRIMDSEVPANFQNEEFRHHKEVDFIDSRAIFSSAGSRKMNRQHKITYRFNIALYIFMMACCLLYYLFSPADEAIVPWDKVYDLYPVTSIIIAISMPLVLTLIGAKMLKHFWDRFVSDLFHLRSIDFQEAWSILLISWAVI